MMEGRSWEQFVYDNEGKTFIKNGRLCPDYKRFRTEAELALLEKNGYADLEEWQMPGFNGCWSCDHTLSCLGVGSKPNSITIVCGNDKFDADRTNTFYMKCRGLTDDGTKEGDWGGIKVHVVFDNGLVLTPEEVLALAATEKGKKAILEKSNLSKHIDDIEIISREEYMQFFGS